MVKVTIGFAILGALSIGALGPLSPYFLLFLAVVYGYVLFQWFSVEREDPARDLTMTYLRQVQPLYATESAKLKADWNKLWGGL